MSGSDKSVDNGVNVQALLDARVALEESRHALRRLGEKGRAHRVGECATNGDARGGGIEQLVLQAAQRGQTGGLLLTVSVLRVAPQRPHAAARRVEHNAVGATVRWQATLGKQPAQTVGIGGVGASDLDA